MIELILMLSLGAVNAPSTIAAGPFQTCVWPNRCASTVEVAAFQPCVWPNKCAGRAEVAKFQPCVWPNRCRADEPVL